MNKHILPYSEKINESIGRGSVLLIKGRPTKEGRFLYVTTINGYAEIKPGIKMVFIGDTIYRVIHKGGDKFSGRKVSYKGEDGLKGVFNMKTPGRPSVVLNHNKTPFHWLTLNHLDVGKALREIGTRLFSHELILESNGVNPKDEAPKSYLLGEVLKLITGRPSALKLKLVDVIDGGEELSEVASDEDESGIYDYESDLELTLVGDKDQTPPEFVKYLDELGLFPYDFGFSDILDPDDFEFLGLSDVPDGLLFNIRYSTDCDVRHIYDAGDHWTPPHSETEIDNVQSRLSDDYSFAIEGDDISIPSDLQSDVEVYNEMIEDQDPSDIVGDLRSLVHGRDGTAKDGGFKRTTELSSQLQLLYYNYVKASVALKKNGL